MKKIISVLISIFIVLTMACTYAYAYAYNTEDYMYDASVANPDGATIYFYDWGADGENPFMGSDRTMPYGETIVIESEVNRNGSIYCLYLDDEETYAVLASDLTSVKETVSPDIGYKYNKKLTAKVFGEGMVLYAGPGSVYDVITEIPEGTVLTYEVTECRFGANWAYFNYNGNSGWGKCSDTYNLSPGETYFCALSKNDRAPYALSEKMLAVNDTELLKTPDDINKTVIADIPKGTELEFEYYVADEYMEYVYVTYEGKSGWVHTGELYDAEISTDSYVRVEGKDDLLLYTDYFNTETATGIIVPKGEMLHCDYVLVDNYQPLDRTPTTRWARVDYEGKKYWARYNVYTSGDNYDFEAGWIVDALEKIEILHDCKLYTEPNINSEELMDIKSGSDVYYLKDLWGDPYLSWYYVYTNGTKGWIENKSLGDHIDYEFLLPADAYPEVASVKTDENLIDGESKDLKVNYTVIVIVAVLAVIAVAIVALVIKKRRKI